ncbi:cspJ [Symbiodinium sp. CCMP2592]|nr:cspJ [Symbiodinium sp. CCMP2592]
MSAVFVSGFDYNTPISTVLLHFSTIGMVKGARFVGQGEAVVTYESSEAAGRAVIELDRSTMQGNRRYVTVRIDQGGKGKGKDGKHGSVIAGYGKGYDRGHGKSLGKDKGGGTSSAPLGRFVGQGEAVVTYESSEAAGRAVIELDRSTMEGNRRHFKGYDKGYGKSFYGKGKGKGGGGRDHFYGEMEDALVATSDFRDLGNLGEYAGFASTTADDRCATMNTEGPGPLPNLLPRRTVQEGGASSSGSSGSGQFRPKLHTKDEALKLGRKDPIAALKIVQDALASRRAGGSHSRDSRS